LLSVLGGLSEKNPSGVDAALSVMGTSLVLFFAHVYAGGLAERIRLGTALGLGDLRRLVDDSWPVAVVTVWPLVLLGLAGFGLIDTAIAVELECGWQWPPWGCATGRQAGSAARDSPAACCPRC